MSAIKNSGVNILKKASGSANVGFLSNHSLGVKRTVEDKLRDINIITDNGPSGDGVGDDILKIQGIIDDTVVTVGTVNRGAIKFRQDAQYLISTEILIHQKNIKFEADNAIIKWAGDSLTAMIRVTDSSRCRFENFILIGDFTTPPLAAMYFEGLGAGAIKGTNENIIVDGCVFGRRFTSDTTTGGSADATPAGRLLSGIIIGGLDGNNDEYTIKNTQIHNCDAAAIDFQNTNSIWSSISNCLLNDNDIGIKQGANLTGYNITFNRNVTADIKGIRQTVMSIFGINAENSKTFIESNAGASFYVDGGKLLRNDITPSYFFNFTSGGHMVLKNLLVVNVQAGVADTIRYSGGSLGGSVKVNDCNITGGDNRDSWNIDTGNTGAVDIPIDINHGKFKFKTSKNYSDRAVTPAAVGPGLKGLVSISPVNNVSGQFMHPAFQFNPQGQHIVNAVDGAGIIRANIFNPTGASITLPAGRMRWLNIDDHIIAAAAALIDVPSMPVNTGVSMTIGVPGARLGDYSAFAADGTFWANVITSYVSADDTVMLRIHNATGATSNPATETLRAAKISEFGNFKAGVVYTPVAIANLTTVNLVATVAGAQLGGHTFVAYTKDLQGLTVTAHVSAVDTVTIVLSNYTGTPVTLASGSFKVMVAF